jgi:prepilin-type processing-associated H-X9-DG protein
MRNRSGFTFLELIVSLSLIMVLVALLFPVFARTRESARRTSCESNLRQIATACHLYAMDNNGHLPPDPGGNVWVEMIQPYVKNHNVFTCPSESPEEHRRYSANYPVSAGSVSADIAYHYRGGLSNDDSGDEPLVRDWESWHAGGLNVAFLDGRVEWESDGQPHSIPGGKRPLPSNSTEGQ